MLALAALAIYGHGISYYWTNYLWYQEMGHTNVFWTPFLGRLLVGLFFAVSFFGLFYGAPLAGPQALAQVPPCGGPAQTATS